MNWLKLIIDLALVIIPGLALKGKKNLEKELEIANQTIKLLSSKMTPEEKGKYIEQAIGELKIVKDLSKRGSKILDKAKSRFYKKLF